MPAEIRFDAVPGVVYCRYEGTLTGDEVLAAWRAAYSDPACRPGTPELIDFSAMDRTELGARDIQALARLRGESHAAAGVSDLRVAAWAPTALARGLARMYVGLAVESREDRRVFVELADALHWLGIAD